MPKLVFELSPRRDVATDPDASDGLTADALGSRIALEYTPVLEQKDIGAFHVRLEIQLAHLLQEFLWLPQLIDHEFQREGVIRRVTDVRRNPPEFDELLIHLEHFSVVIHDENAVGRSFERCREGGQCLIASFLRALALRERLLQPLESILQFGGDRLQGVLQHRAVLIGLAVGDFHRGDERANHLRDVIRRHKVLAELSGQQLVHGTQRSDSVVMVIV